jgi:excisionase family DNA binding protein
MQDTDIQAPLAFTREQVSALLNLSIRKVDYLISQRELRTFRVGKRRMTSRSALDEFIRRKEQKK